MRTRGADQALGGQVGDELVAARRTRERHLVDPVGRLVELDPSGELRRRPPRRRAAAGRRRRQPMRVRTHRAEPAEHVAARQRGEVAEGDAARAAAADRRARAGPSTPTDRSATNAAASPAGNDPDRLVDVVDPSRLLGREGGVGDAEPRRGQRVVGQVEPA